MIHDVLDLNSSVFEEITRLERRQRRLQTATVLMRRSCGMSSNVKLIHFLSDAPFKKITFNRFTDTQYISNSSSDMKQADVISKITKAVY